MSLYKLMSVNDKKYVYDSWHNILMQIDKDFYDILNNNIQNDKYKKYINHYGLRNLFIDEDFIFEDPIKNSSYLWKIKNAQKQLILGLTEQCNMRCEYCGYYETRYIKNDHPVVMSKEILEKALFNFLQNSVESDEAGIIFYGGEPLLCMNLIKHAVEYTNKNHLGQKIEYLVSTNGLLLNDDSIVDFLVSNNFHFLISLDGPSSLHDRYRVDLEGKSTHSRIVNNLKKIKNKYPEFFKTKVTFNTVICPPYNIELLFDYFKELNVNYFELNPSNFFKDKLRERYGNIDFDKNENFEISDPTSIIKQVKNLKKYHLSKTLPKNTINKLSLASGFCHPLERKLYVTPEGKIFLCERVDETNEDFCLGDVTHGIDYIKLRNLLKKTIDILKKNCSKCWAIRLCNTCFTQIEKINYRENYCINMRLQIEREFKQYIKLIDDDKSYIDLFNNLTVD